VRTGVEPVRIKNYALFVAAALSGVSSYEAALLCMGGDWVSCGVGDSDEPAYLDFVGAADHTVAGDEITWASMN